MRKHWLIWIVALLPGAAPAAPQDTVFTYQGQLTDVGVPASGAYDFEFCLFGSLAGSDLSGCMAPLETVPVDAGVFTVTLDFDPNLFLGEQQFLEIRVRPDASLAAFTTLTPRQAITATPYALRALGVSNDTIGSFQIVDSSISTIDLTPNAVGTTRLQDSAVTTAKLADGSVTTAKLADNSVTSAKVVDLAIGPDDLGTGSVSSSKIANGAVGLNQIDTTQVQARISVTCAVGQYFRGVGANGAVVCEPMPGVQRITTVEDVPALSFGSEVSIAIGADGLPVVAYRESSQGSLRVAKCGDSACSANNTLTEIIATGDTGKEPNIAIGSDGLPALAFVNQSADVTFVHCGNAACSSGNTTALIEGSANNLGSSLTLAIGSDGLPIMAYGDRTAQSLKFARCTTVTCGVGSVSVIELDNPANDVGIEVAMTVGSDGFPFMVYRDFTDGSVDAVHCGSVDCVSGNVLTPAVATVGAIKVDYAVVAQPAPLGPLVVYRDPAPAATALFVLQCGNNDCASGNTTTTVNNPANHKMQAMSLRLGVGGLPTIGFHNAANATLGLLRCGDRGCSSGNTFTTVDHTFGVTGLPNALALGADGLPVMAYAFSTDGALRVVKCASASCQ